ncbi:hypothetical protein E4634_07425 [Mangrovimicrobium sediminis]|uniref:Glycosyl transferase family 1 domain-containing protein n=1 Tax=Mangrovimicrobium sediminis TaxID=2562682 RepID=A0A4Z0M3T4_9GAMM|nr:glycosyltransferase [Haliea sp. SAOS-164]TGD73965.1 hypothetical protein E4634_07425 [Haliea sp. SAOS-164]
MRVIVYEPKFVGHFLGFASYAANAYARRGHSVRMTVGREAGNTPQAVEKLATLHPGVDVEYCLDVPICHQKRPGGRQEAEALEAILDTRECDQLVVPSADFLLHGLLGNRRLRRQLRALSGSDLILHNIFQAYPGRGKRERVYLLADMLALDLAASSRIYTVDPFAVRASGPRLSFLGRSITEIPHPFDQPESNLDKQQARAALGLSADDCLIGSIGDLGVRKGTELLIRSFAGSGLRGKARLLLFGLVSPSARQTLEEHAELVDDGSIIVRDEFVSDQDFRHFCHAIDLMWAGYPNHVGISSILLHAANAGTPVLASEFGSVGWMTQEYGLGRAVPPTDAAMSAALAQFVEGERWSISADDAQRLMESHTTRRFEEVLLRRDHLGQLSPTSAPEAAREYRL